MTRHTDRSDGDAQITKELEALDCHECGTAITATTGVHSDGWSFRGGSCPDCGRQAAFVDVQPQDIRQFRQNKLAKRQDTLQADSLLSAASFLDRAAPQAGRYHARRVDDHTVQVQLPEAHDPDDEHFTALLGRLRNATHADGRPAWYVGVVDEQFVNLADQDFGRPNQADIPPAVGADR